MFAESVRGDDRRVDQSLARLSAKDRAVPRLLRRLSGWLRRR